MSDNVIRWERDADGIVVLTIDDPQQSANTMNADFLDSLDATVLRLQGEKKDIRGVVIASAKRTFFAGGDLNDLREWRNPDVVAAFAGRTKAALRSLELLGHPMVAVIHGAALGGGLEICLAAHYRIAVDDERIQLGFPEVTLGLLPGAGGLVRSVRLIGIRNALEKLLLRGERLNPQAALDVGVIDELVASRDDLIAAAKRWIGANPEASQPWDREGYLMPGGKPETASLAAILPSLAANLSKQIRGANYPAPKAILSAAVEGAQVDFENASEIETRYFTELACGQVAKNMIQAFFFDLQRANGSRGRAAGVPFVPQKVVVLGAGMMGSAIAYVCARSGGEVILKDVSLEAAERGRAYSERLIAKAVQRGGLSQADGESLLSRIHPSASASDASGAELVIEAVFEDPGLKGQVSQEIEPHLVEGALFGTNTSTLPITSLAQSVAHPSNYIGLHFFSPVDKMPLLEIIKGAETSDDALDQALDVARWLRKTPIVVNDSRGFFTSRVISTFLNEAMAMVVEGISGPTIEQASGQAGYPAPVLQLCDELNLTLMQRIRDAARDASKAHAEAWVAHPAEVLIDEMVARGRPGRIAQMGFYEYEDGRRTRLWPGIAELFPPVADPSSVSLHDCTERMLFIESLETVRCLDEHVLESVADANVGSILGIGFPGWTGGVLQYINGYEGGLAGFVSRAQELAGRFGKRFEPPASLVDRAERGEPYSDDVLSAETK